MEATDKNDPDSRLALVLFRNFLGVDQGDFARAARIAPSQLSVYERGQRATPREVLERAAVAAGFPLHLLDSLLWGIRSFRAAAGGRSRADRIFASGMAAEVISLIQMAADVILEPLGPWAPEPPGTAELWAHLEECNAPERRMLVEELEEYWSGELCKRVAGESLRKAASHPEEALELAELAVLIAERVPGERAWSLRLQGYAWAHVSKARRICHDLLGAEEARSRARKLWEAGAPGGPGFLDEAWLPELLYRAQHDPDIH